MIRTNMLVSNLKYLPSVDCFMAEMGGKPIYLFACCRFRNVRSYAVIRSCKHRHFAWKMQGPSRERKENHRLEPEEEGTVDTDPYWDFLIKELIVNNLATYYLAGLRVLEELQRLLLLT